MNVHMRKLKRIFCYLPTSFWKSWGEEVVQSFHHVFFVITSPPPPGQGFLLRELFAIIKYIFKFASCLKITIKYTLLFNPIVGIEFFCIATPPPTDLFPHIEIPPPLMTSYMHRITVRMFQV